MDLKASNTDFGTKNFGNRIIFNGRFANYGFLHLKDGGIYNVFHIGKSL